MIFFSVMALLLELNLQMQGYFILDMRSGLLGSHNLKFATLLEQCSIIFHPLVNGRLILGSLFL